MVKIYGLVCPESGLIRYIGKTQGSVQRRLVAHITESRKRHSHKQRWIARCVADDQRPQIWILEEVSAVHKWQDRERAWIKKARDIGLDLTNQTAGGEGLDFMDPVAKANYSKKMSAVSRRRYWESPEHRMALIRAGKKSWAEGRQQRIDACRRGWTPEAKQRHVAAMSEVRSRPNFKESQSAGSKKAWAKHRDSMLAGFATEACKAKQSVSKKRAWSDPDTRDRMMNRWTPEAKAKQAVELAARQEKIKAAMTPEVRAKQAAKLKETWAKRKAAMNESNSNR